MKKIHFSVFISLIFGIFPLLLFLLFYLGANSEPIRSEIIQSLSRDLYLVMIGTPIFTLVAINFGIIGIVKSIRVQVTGKYLAIAGIILGLISLIFWIRLLYGIADK